MKSIWELTAPATKYPIGLQNKQGKIYALRPYNFHKKPENSFKSKYEFLEAIKEARELFPIEGMIPTDDWIKQVKR